MAAFHMRSNVWMSIFEKSLRVKALAALLLLSGSLAAFASQEIGWERLVPATEPALKQEVDELQREVQLLAGEDEKNYFRIDEEMMLRRQIEVGLIQEERLMAMDKAMLADSPSRAHPEMKALWDRVDAVRKRLAAQDGKVDGSLDGMAVRMPGYVLPLELTGGEVREFLLVPFVGACIHVPPPPPNQMVFVAADRPFVSEGLYEPVWVEGVLSARGGSHSLSLVDGSSTVATGYSMRATKVTRHER